MCETIEPGSQEGGVTSHLEGPGRDGKGLACSVGLESRLGGVGGRGRW